MRLAGIQHDIVWEEPSATMAHLEPLVAGAAATGAELICLSEMFTSGFSMNTAVVAEPMDGPSVTFLHRQASRHGVLLCGSVPTIHPDHELPVNRLVVVDGNGVIGEYAKIHPFSFSGEDRHYGAGDRFCTLELAGVRCTFFVCYDLRFADEFWVTAADTDCYVVVANWPAARRLHWQTLLRARAIENQAYVLGVNRVGTDPALTYLGDSALVDPLGETLTSASTAETVIIGEVDPRVVRQVREQFPFQADRR